MSKKIKKIKNILNTFSVLILVFLGIYLISNWKFMPGMIAMRFDIFGKPLSYFPKVNLIYIFAICIFLCVFAIVSSCLKNENSDFKTGVKNIISSVSGALLSIFSSYMVIRYSKSKCIEQVMVFLFLFFELLSLIFGIFLIFKEKSLDS